MGEVLTIWPEGEAYLRWRTLVRVPAVWSIESSFYRLLAVLTYGGMM